MSKIVFTGWEPGFNKVGLNKLMRARLGLSLSESMELVDSILDEKEVVVDVPSLELAQSVLNESIELGANGRLE